MGIEITCAFTCSNAQEASGTTFRSGRPPLPQRKLYFKVAYIPKAQSVHTLVCIVMLYPNRHLEKFMKYLGPAKPK